MSDAELRLDHLPPEDEDYLWSGSGEPDPELAALERALAPLRTQASLPELPRRRRWVAPLLALAALALGALALGLLQRGRGEARGWELEVTRGAPRRGDTVLAGRALLLPDEWLETPPDAEARLYVPGMGRVDVEGGSRVAVRESDPSQHRLELAVGRIEAHIVAPPRAFVVQTPAADAVDLGCAYTLEVGDDGRGLLEVTAGWVAFERDEQQVLIPRGARCETRLEQGPGTPHRADASPALREALSRIDFGELDGPLAELEVVCTESRPVDTLSLWHLLSRLEERGDRRLIADRIAELVPDAPLRPELLERDAEALRVLGKHLRPLWDD